MFEHPTYSGIEVVEDEVFYTLLDELFSDDEAVGESNERARQVANRLTRTSEVGRLCRTTINSRDRRN